MKINKLNNAKTILSPAPPGGEKRPFELSRLYRAAYKNGPGGLWKK
jgi:hypothetical protein